ncbi:MAG: hypothetical protein ABI686_09645 [Acidobacteriota bacterium]
MNKVISRKIIKKGIFGTKVNFLHQKKYLFSYFLLFTCCFLLSVPSFAQEEEPQMTAPPPLKAISKEEKSQLNAETDVKRHTKLALGLMSVRLTSAENFNNQQQYIPMFNELGAFHALVDDTLDYLKSNDTDSGKVLNNFKRLEMSLRGFAPRLELIRRDLPLKYELYVRKLIIYMREARTKAVEPLFSNSVVSDVDNKNP